MTDTTALRTTTLHPYHLALGARMGPYAGWEMPLEYSGITDEHMAVRRRAGVFDVGHMGEIEVAGKNALAALQRLCSNDASVLAVGGAQYSALLTPEGTFIDDIVVYRMAPSHFMLVVNAANTAKDLAWIGEHVAGARDVAVVDSSSRYGLIAIQGPAARDVLQPLTAVDLAEIRRYRFAHGEVAACRVTISRTGYTGEDGYEIFVPPTVAGRVWQALLESGRGEDVIPCGLGARDTLRLEAAMPLYGNDIDESTTVIEAGLGWTIGWDKGDFIGRDRLREQQENGPARTLIGFEMIEGGIARHGYAVSVAGSRVGAVTSGTHAPFLGRAIGMAYVPVALTAPGTEIDIDIRGRAAKARVVPRPFYKRGVRS